jgi:hypothetical protein
MLPRDANPPPEAPGRRYVCDLCGEPIDRSGTGRYVVTIDVRAAPDSPQITEEDLKRDIAAEMTRLIRKMEQMSLDEIEDGVHRMFRFDLCPGCQKRFLADPLGRSRPAGDDG